MSDSPAPHPSAGRLRQCDGFVHIPFAPVLVKARHDGWTPARQRGFIDRLAVTGCVAICARAVGKTPQSAYRLRERRGAASFRAAWDRALAAGQSYQIDIALERAIYGDSWSVGPGHKGVRPDNRIAMAALNADRRRPPNSRR